MGRLITQMLIKLAVIVFIISMIISTTGLSGPLLAADDQGSAVVTIPSTEVKEDQEEGSEEVSLEEVEDSRKLTRNRLYGLAGFWAVVIMCIFLVYLQSKDDEKLYQEGYYTKDLK